MLSGLADRLIHLFDAHKGAWAEVGFVMFLASVIYGVQESGWSSLFYVLPAAVGYRMVGRWIDEETR